MTWFEHTNRVCSKKATQKSGEVGGASDGRCRPTLAGFLWLPLPWRTDNEAVAIASSADFSELT